MTFDIRSVGLLVGPWLAVAVLAILLVRRWAGPPTIRHRHRIVWVLRGCMLAALAVIGSNPVHVDVTPGAVRRPEVHILLDASQSMLLDSPKSRWEEGTELLRAALLQSRGRADIRIHRFGQRLVPVDVAAFETGGDPRLPDDSDTQLATAFRQLGSQLGREPPAAVIVVSDGRVRNPESVKQMSALWKRLRVPVHVVPLGRATSGGDVAIIAAIAPAKARTQSQVDINVFLRSFGFAGERADLQLQALGPNGAVRHVIRSVPISLQDGVQTVTLTFRTEPDQKRLRLHIPPSPRDVAPANNDFPLEIELDRSKVRVMLVEGSADARVFQFGDGADGAFPVRNALLADPDIQCSVFGTIPGVVTPLRITLGETGYPYPFPRSAAELMAYDAIVLSNVPRSALSDEMLGWLEEWIGKRGGGLIMAGGPQSFGAGGWAGSPLERMLPVELLGGPDWDGSATTLEPAGSELHPVWRLFEDERATRAALRTLPEATGHNNWVRVKPQSGTLLGRQKSLAEAGSGPLLAVGAYGRGRTLALATPLSAALAPQFARQWGEGDNRHFARFARNLVNWTTENSAIGRRRLVPATDKRFYHPGETIAVLVQAFDETATRSGRYRVVAVAETKQLEGAEPPCPVKWPAGKPRPASSSGNFAAWGEEIELQLDPETKDYQLMLPLVEALPAGRAGQAFKLELTAFDGETQVDSSSTDVQILSDPQELQNPLPNRAFLAELARTTGGREFTDAKSLADALAALPIAESPPTIRETPLWNSGMILWILLALLGTEWICRRWLGLA